MLNCESLIDQKKVLKFASECHKRNFRAKLSYLHNTRYQIATFRNFRYITTAKTTNKGEYISAKVEDNTDPITHPTRTRPCFHHS